MESPSLHRRAAAFTLVELLVVIGIIALLAALLLPALSGGQKRAQRIWCVSNLKQTGLAFQSFAHDHNGKFPMAVSVSDGGSLEFAQNGLLVNGNFYFGYRHFQPLANYLDSTKVLICPVDTRVAATNFADLQNANISYFVGVDSEYSKPESILAGDGNLATTHTLLRNATGENLAWNGRQHQYKGNVLFADGHVEEWGNSSPSTALANAENFVIPTVNPSSSPAGGSTPIASSQPLPAARPARAASPAGYAPSTPATRPLVINNSPVGAGQTVPPQKNPPSGQTNQPGGPPPPMPLELTPTPAVTVATNPVQSYRYDASKRITRPESPTLEAPIPPATVPVTNSPPPPPEKPHPTSSSWAWLLSLLIIAVIAALLLRRFLRQTRRKR
ncbi:MAG TPA: prepilin-type N-terminal cleavage/methylation domain-containing protein [Verrucomicrobiae bacterium]|nr:prepilin-type N-terminal cleavage/methylation domain-containing protein [Verrucomicrobiae bacterium]